MSCNYEGSTHFACECVLKQLKAADALVEAVKDAMPISENGTDDISPFCRDQAQAELKKLKDALANFEKVIGKKE